MLRWLLLNTILPYSIVESLLLLVGGYVMLVTTKYNTTILYSRIFATPGGRLWYVDY